MQHSVPLPKLLLEAFFSVSSEIFWILSELSVSESTFESVAESTPPLECY